MIKSLNQRSKHFNQLDGLRCIAVAIVLISHWLRYKAVDLVPLGSMGVNLFFVLSGFLITRILLISKEENGGKAIWPPIKHFYLRRTLRIFPIYYLTIIFLALINFPSTRENIAWLLTYTFNIKISLLSASVNNSVGFLFHLWSLSVEEQFYIFFPLLLFLIPKSKIKSFIYSVILFGVASRLILYVLAAPKDSLYGLMPCCLDAFGIGALLAYYMLYELELLERILRNNYIFLIAVIMFVSDIIFSRIYISGYTEGRTIVERFLFSVCCFWLVGKASLDSYKGVTKRFLENKAVVYLGKISYGIYIYHYFIFTLLNNYLDPFLRKHFHWKSVFPFDNILGINNLVVTTLFLFLVTIAVASLSWHFIEKPINRLKERIRY
jgi:peptidoglycan/LPS O-acetylase OafA/YrhL